MSSLEKFTLQLYITTENPVSFTSFTIFHEFILREGILKLSGAPPSESSQTVPRGADDQHLWVTRDCGLFPPGGNKSSIPLL